MDVGIFCADKLRREDRWDRVFRQHGVDLIGHVCVKGGDKQQEKEWHNTSFRLGFWHKKGHSHPFICKGEWPAEWRAKIIHYGVGFVKFAVDLHHYRLKANNCRILDCFLKLIDLDVVWCKVLFSSGLCVCCVSGTSMAPMLRTLFL